MQPNNNITSDINWRNIDDDETWELIRKNPESEVLIQTDVSYRIDRVEYIEDSYRYGAWLRTAHEKVLRIAFL